jgi:hypothetical protein
MDTLRRCSSLNAVVAIFICLSLAVAFPASSLAAGDGEMTSDEVAELVSQVLVGGVETRMNQAAKELSPLVPDPAWRLALDAWPSHEIEDVRTLESGRVLVVVEKGPLVMLAGDSGEILWRADRNAANDVVSTIVQTEPVLLIEELTVVPVKRKKKGEAPDEPDMRTTHVALDPDSGRELWIRPSDARTSLTPLYGGTHGIFSALADEFLLDYVDLSSGESIWSSRVAGTGKTEPQLVTTTAGVLVLGQDATMLSLEDGSRRWDLPGIGPIAPLSTLPVHGLAYVLPAADGRISKVELDGSVEWTARLEAAPADFTVSGDLAFAHLAGSPSRIAAISMDTGTVAWEYAAEGPLMSAIVAADERVFFTQCNRDDHVNSLVVLDAESGDVGREMPVSVYGDDRLPDYILPFGDQVTLVHDQAIASYDLADGNRLWHIPTEWDYSYSRIALSAKEALDSYEEWETLLREKGYLPSTRNYAASARADWGDAASRQWTAASAANTAWVFQHTEFTLQQAAREEADLPKTSLLASDYTSAGKGGVPPNPYDPKYNLGSPSRTELTRLARRHAHESRINAISGEIAAREVAASMDRMTATIAMHTAAWDVMFQMQKQNILRSFKKIEEEYQELAWFYERAMGHHSWAVQDAYYIHPFLNWPEKGADDPFDKHQWYGYLVVNLEDGRWARVATSPEAKLFTVGPFLSDHRQAADQRVRLTADGRHLVSRGVGLDSEAWKTDPEETIFQPWPSLLAVSVDSLDWRQPAEFVPRPLYGYIDTSGEFVVAPRYPVALEFSEGLAVVGTKTHRGYIDTEGRVVVPTFYTGAGAMHEGLAPVRRDERWVYIDREGNQVFEGRTFHSPGAFSDGVAGVCVEENRCGFMNKDGEFIVEPIYDKAYDFSEGYGWARRHRPRMPTHKDFCFDANGKEVIRSKGYHAYAGGFVEGRISVRKRSAWSDKGIGFIDTKGAMVIKPGYDQTRSFSEGRAAVKIGDKWGYIDPNGKLVIRAQFEFAEQFDDGLAAVRKDSLWGYVDREGKVILDFQYKKASTFADGLAAVAVDQEYLRDRLGYADPPAQDVYGYIDRSGKFVIEPKFSEARAFSEGRAVAKPLRRALEIASAKPAAD